MTLDRDAIRRGAFREMAANSRRHGRIWTDAERDASKNAMLSAVPDGDDVWVFGYGSLMWNPAFHFVDRLPGRVHGYHRSYCMISTAGRGTEAQPGMMLALEPGGSCCGLAFRIAANSVHEELDIVWAREMLAGTYRPVWVTVAGATSTVRAITFASNQRHDRYVGRLDPATVVQRLATAEGRLGSCQDYLKNTVSCLSEFGFRDRRMTDLLLQVQRYPTP